MYVYVRTYLNDSKPRTPTYSPITFSLHLQKLHSGFAVRPTVGANAATLPNRYYEYTVPYAIKLEMDVFS